MLNNKYKVMSEVRSINRVKHYIIQDVFMEKKQVTKKELIGYVREGLIENAYIFNEELLVFRFVEDSKLSYRMASNFVKQELAESVLEEVKKLEKGYEEIDLSSKLLRTGTRVEYDKDERGGFILHELKPIVSQDLSIPEFITCIPFDFSYFVQKKLNYMCEESEREKYSGRSVYIGQYTNGLPMEALVGDYKAITLGGTQSCILSSFLDAPVNIRYNGICHVNVSKSMNYIGKGVFNGISRRVDFVGTDGLRVLYTSDNFSNTSVYDTTILPFDTDNSAFKNLVVQKYTKRNREPLMRFKSYIEDCYLSCQVSRKDIRVLEDGSIELLCRDKKQSNTLSSLLAERYKVVQMEDSFVLLLKDSLDTSYVGAMNDLLAYLSMRVEEFMLEYAYAVFI